MRRIVEEEEDAQANAQTDAAHAANGWVRTAESFADTYGEGYVRRDDPAAPSGSLKTETPENLAPAPTGAEKKSPGKASPRANDNDPDGASATSQAASFAADDPRPLYVSRWLLNASELLDWARSQGFTTTLSADDLHVTITYDPGEIDLAAIEPYQGRIILAPERFEANPGTAHLRAVAEKAARSIEQALQAGLEDAARQTLREIVDDVAFEQFLALPQPNFPVMILGTELRDTIGAQARVATLSEQTMAKQAGKRSDLPVTVYRQLPDLADRADIVARDGDNVLIFARESDGSWTVAVVKATASSEGLFVTSVRSQNAASLPRLLKGTEVIVDRR